MRVKNFCTLGRHPEYAFKARRPIILFSINDGCKKSGSS
jgi:hypothetical protein